jgi:hypothetical protein
MHLARLACAIPYCSEITIDHQRGESQRESGAAPPRCEAKKQGDRACREAYANKAGGIGRSSEL